MTDGRAALLIRVVSSSFLKKNKEINGAQIGAESKQLSPRRISLSTNKNFLLTFAFQCGLFFCEGGSFLFSYL